MGVSIAMHAARRTDPLRDPVVLLEKRSLGSGSSGRSGAILRQFYASRSLAGMARDSLQTYAAFARRTGRSVGFQRTGVLTFAASPAPEDVEELERTVAGMSSLGIEVRRLGAEEIRSLVPGIALREGSVGAFEPGGGFVDPKLTVDSFAALARTYGAVIRPGQEVQEIVFSGGRVAAIETEDERIDCEQVVVALGPWTPRFLARHGVQTHLFAQRTQQHFVHSPGPDPEDEVPFERGEGALGDVEGSGATDWIMGGLSAARRNEPQIPERFQPATELGRAAHPVLLDLENGFYARCEPSGRRTRVGRLDHDGEPRVEDPDDYPSALEPGFADWARGALVRRLPAYSEQPDLDGETALYTMSPDQNAILGPIDRYEGLFVASGFSGHGFKLAPSVGEGMAQMLAGEPVSAFEPEFFSLARFKSGEPLAPSRPFGL